MADPERVSGLLKSMIQAVKTEASRSDLNQALEQVLGPEQIQHCQVLGFRNGRLVVEVDSAPLFAEFTGFRREEIRGRMNELLRKRKVAQVVFRMGGTGHV